MSAPLSAAVQVLQANTNKPHASSEIPATSSVVLAGWGGEVDMWAFGILVYWMLSGRTPFEAATISNIFVNIETGRWSFRGDCWNGVSEEAKVTLRAQEQDMVMTHLRQLTSVQQGGRGCHAMLQGMPGVKLTGWHAGALASALTRAVTGPAVPGASCVRASHKVHA